MKYAEFKQLLNELLKSGLLDDVKFMSVCVKSAQAIHEQSGTLNNLAQKIQASIEGTPDHPLQGDLDELLELQQRFGPELQEALTMWEQALLEMHQQLIAARKGGVDFPGLTPEQRGAIAGKLAGLGIEQDRAISSGYDTISQIYRDSRSEREEPPAAELPAAEPLPAESYNPYVEYMQSGYKLY